MLTGCPSMLMFRSGFTAFYNLEEDSGTEHFAGHRIGCWVNAIPANGLVMIPESGAGCVCLFSIESTVTMEPRGERRPWTIYSSVGAKTPVAHMALNLGAPGDRKDARGKVWLSYPRPSTSKETALDLKFDLGAEFLKDGGYTSINSELNPVEGVETPWLFTSSARGLSRCQLPLLGLGEAPADYRVTLYFAEMEPDAKPGERVFDVNLQGKTVLANFDIVTEAGGVRRGVIRVFENIRVTDNLRVELIPRVENPTPEQMPLLSAIEAVRTSNIDKASE
jgi:hypothetical protein